MLNNKPDALNLLIQRGQFGLYIGQYGLAFCVQLVVKLLFFQFCVAYGGIQLADLNFILSQCHFQRADLALQFYKPVGRHVAFGHHVCHAKVLLFQPFQLLLFAALCIVLRSHVVLGGAAFQFKHANIVLQGPLAARVQHCFCFVLPGLKRVSGFARGFRLRGGVEIVACFFFKTFCFCDQRLALNLQWQMGHRQELRVKLETIALDARMRQAWQVGPGGRPLPTSEPIPDFSLANLGFQVRYRYELAPLSDLYVVYGRGGGLLEDGSRPLAELLGDATSLRDAEQLLVKLSYRFAN